MDFYCLFRLVLTLEIINVWILTDFVFYHLGTKYICEPSKMLQLLDSPIQDLVCKKSLMELRVECPKSNKNCLRYVEKAKCYIDQWPVQDFAFQASHYSALLIGWLHLCAREYVGQNRTFSIIKMLCYVLFCSDRTF